MRKLLFLLFFLSTTLAAQGDKFRFCVLKHSGNYLPHPTAVRSVLVYLKSTTSIDPPLKVFKEEIGDKIFNFPFLYLSAKGALPDFSGQEIGVLSRHLTSGGFLLIDEAENYGSDDFLLSVKNFVRKIFPDKDFVKIPPSDVIFKSFYLKPKVAGRTDTSPYLWGIKKGGRWVVVYCRDDLLGAWARDASGRFLYDCLPGGESQRLEAIKVTVNIIMYSLTGTYKQDIIHRKFIERKLESW